MTNDQFVRCTNDILLCVPCGVGFRVALDIEDDLVWQVMAPQVIASERTPLRTLPKVIGSQRSWRILLFDADAGAGASR
jgi:hypothetical protein